MIIRDATFDDIRELVVLLAQLGYKQDIDEFTEDFRSFVERDGYHIFVAEIDQKIAGMIAISTTHIITKKTRIEIEALIVKEKYRRRKVGSNLIKHVENYAKQYAPVVIQLVSNIKRKRAHEFYKNLGYGNEGQNEKAYFRKDI